MLSTLNAHKEEEQHEEDGKAELNVELVHFIPSECPNKCTTSFKLLGFMTFIVHT